MKFLIWFTNFLFLTLFLIVESVDSSQAFFDDICGQINGQRIYLEHGESGTLISKYENRILKRENRFIDILNNKNASLIPQKRCTVEFVTCPFCVVQMKFRFLNISRNCGKSSVFDSCGCDYVWIYEPSFEEVSGEQFCGHFIANNISTLTYSSQTRKVAVTFLYGKNYGHAFTLDYVAERNRVLLSGSPSYSNMNNASQTISSPFFPNLYPPDLSMEHQIVCQSMETCRISLVFTDFRLSDSSIIEFFDWNGQRLYTVTGSIVRPPIILTSGPSLLIRFYANGATDYGFRATYSYILGDFNDTQYKPDLDCGGYVNNLGGGITMMNMVAEGSKVFDCVWLIRPPGAYFHMKTHLYVKVITFSNFAGNTEMFIHQGLTSKGPLVETLRLPLAHFYAIKEKEHIVPIAQGFYIRLRGIFRPESQMVIVYAAFNYKDCYAGSDFLCHNLRCISTLLNCDGFDHCGDNSDELVTSCSQDPRDRRQWSKTPNFFFPKVEGYSDLTTATLVFLLCSFGLVGLIFAMAILLYRINQKTRHQRQIQNHIETIHAILEEGVGEIEEEIIIADDPPDYEPPPEYEDAIKTTPLAKKNSKSGTKLRRCSRCVRENSTTLSLQGAEQSLEGTSKSCQTTPVKVPDSPPPAYGGQNANSDEPGPSGIGPDLPSESNSITSKALLWNSLIDSAGDVPVKCFSESELADLVVRDIVRPTLGNKSFSFGDIISLM